jgi:vacuolar-type H+-ATPase subunit I/STV1
MRITLLQLATLLIFVGCEQKQNRFDVKSREFNPKSSHHYSEKFHNANTANNEIAEFDSLSNKPSTQIEAIDTEVENFESPNKEGIFAEFFSAFSSSDERLDSLDKVINDCEESLYTHVDEASSQQSAINSLIGERNYLLKQLDSLQTVIFSSTQISNRKLLKLKQDHKKLKSLIELLSTEIE